MNAREYMNFIYLSNECVAKSHALKKARDEALVIYQFGLINVIEDPVEASHEDIMGYTQEIDEYHIAVARNNAQSKDRVN
jgi:hypothetical protein